MLIGFSPKLLYHFNLGVIWICILFSFLPERWFQNDFEDGTLELYLLSSNSLCYILISKLSGYWAVKLSGVLGSLPFLAFLYSFHLSISIFFNMMIGSLAFTLICGIHSCLTLGLKSNTWSSIQQLTTLPTLLPLILLLGQNKDISSQFLLLGYLGLLCVLYLIFVPTTLRRIISQ
jgi:heme exporter protein B